MTLFAGLAISAPISSVYAGHEGLGNAPFDFEYTLNAGQPTPIEDQLEGGRLFDLTINTLLIPPDAIGFLEFEIAGLSHEAPGDINIILISPRTNGGVSIEIMDDRGGQNSISGVNLTFRDGESELPFNDPIVTGRYAPESPLSLFLDGTNYGTDPWLVLVIDDSPGGSGSFDSLTLRGHFVPEPATLSLLMLGALAMFHRRRR